MTWIDRRLADLEEWKARNAAIRESAAEIYDALWHEIAGHVGDGNAKGFHVITNGAPRKRLVKLEEAKQAGPILRDRSHPAGRQRPRSRNGRSRRHDSRSGRLPGWRDLPEAEREADLDRGGGRPNRGDNANPFAKSGVTLIKAL